MTQIKTITTTEYPSGIFQVIVNFDSRHFFAPFFASSEMLCYYDESSTLRNFKINRAIYNKKDVRDYEVYSNTEKEQVVFTFIPFALVDNPTREVDYDRDFNETRKYVAV